jgi:hypothetical protein
VDDEDSYAAADEVNEEWGVPKKMKKSEHRADVTFPADGSDF